MSDSSTFTDPHSRFEIVTSELRVVGVSTLKRFPGEYCVNFRYGGEKTARMADDLDQALELGRVMAAKAAAGRKAATKPGRQWRRKRRMPRKAQPRRFIRRNRRIRRPRRQSDEH